MKSNLPYLDQERLNLIFENVYEGYLGKNEVTENSRYCENEKINDLIVALKSMQFFNYKHRPDDVNLVYDTMSQIFRFEINSEGTSLWLSLILAVKELYGFTEKKLISVMKQVTICK